MRTGPEDAPSNATPAAEDGPLIEVDPAAEEAKEATREDLIRRAAYRRYQERGGEGGNASDDWLQAEREIDDASEKTPETPGPPGTTTGGP